MYSTVPLNFATPKVFLIVAIWSASSLSTPFQLSPITACIAVSTYSNDSSARVFGTSRYTFSCISFGNSFNTSAFLRLRDTSCNTVFSSSGLLQP